MNIPDCYDPCIQAERREKERDDARSRWGVCGCCGCDIRPGERFYTVVHGRHSCLLCRSCKEDVDESEAVMEEVVFHGV